MFIKNFLRKNYDFYKNKKSNNGTLLFVDRERIDTLFHQSILSLAISNKFNLNTVILTDQKTDSLIVNTYRKLGFDKFINGYNKKLILNPFILFLTTYYSIISLIKLKKFGIKWLINNFKIKEIIIGDLIYDTNVRYEQRFKNLEIDFKFIRLHFTSIFRFFIIYNCIRKLNIKKILIGSETGSRNQGLALRISSKLRIKNYAFYRVNDNGLSLISYNQNYYKNGIDHLSKKKFIKLSSKISTKKVNFFYKNRKKLKKKIGIHYKIIEILIRLI